MSDKPVTAQPKESRDSSGSTMVDGSYHWREITKDTPRGVKLQLINRYAGVAVYGTLNHKDTYWTHYAPLPTFKERLL